MRILIDSLSKSFADVLVGYSLVPIIRDKYPYAEISLGCSPIDTRLFRKSRCLDNVVIQSIYQNMNNWCQYELIFQDNFTLDSQWNPQKMLGEFDTPDNWSKNTVQLGFEFLKADYHFFDNFKRHLPNKKLVGIFYTVPHPNDPYAAISHIGPKKIEQIIKQFGQLSDVAIVLFCSFPERYGININEPNLVNFGAIDKIIMGMLFEQMDVLITNTSSIFAYSNFFDINRIVLSSRATDGSYMWNGVPDDCVVPHLRLQALTEKLQGNSVTKFVYPESYANQIEWKYNDFITGEERGKKMLSLDQIDERKVAQLAIDMIDGRAQKDDYDICEKCNLAKNGKCMYWWQG